MICGKNSKVILLLLVLALAPLSWLSSLENLEGMTDQELTEYSLTEINAARDELMILKANMDLREQNLNLRESGLMERERILNRREISLDKTVTALNELESILIMQKQLWQNSREEQEKAERDKMVQGFAFGFGIGAISGGAAGYSVGRK